MIMIWNRKEVFVGWSMEQFYNVRRILAENKIKYTFKVVSNSAPTIFGSGRGHTGNFGEDMRFSTTNYVYVHKKDFDQACVVLRELHR